MIKYYGTEDKGCLPAPTLPKNKVFCPSLSWEETLHEDFSLSLVTEMNSAGNIYLFSFHTNTKKKKKRSE